MDFTSSLCPVRLSAALVFSYFLIVCLDEYLLNKFVLNKV
jgi:hypothetical protein